jgi:hypothetical protein
LIALQGSTMTDTKEAEAFAEKVLATMGPAETLLMAMRLLLLVGKNDPDNPQVVARAQEAVNAIKALGELTGAFKVAN